MTLRRIFLVIMTVLWVSAAGLGTATGSPTDNLYTRFNGKSVKIFVAMPTDKSQEKKADLADLRRQMESVLGARKNVRFQVMSDPAAADLTVDTQVTEFLWLKEDPVDMVGGLSMAAWDMLDVENYVRMQAAFTVTDARQNKSLWQDKVAAMITKKEMPEKESVPLINEKMAKVFVNEVFGKAGSSESKRRFP